VAKGLIHRNAASRRKSRLVKSLRKASEAAAS